MHYSHMLKYRPNHTKLPFHLSSPFASDQHAVCSYEIKYCQTVLSVRLTINKIVATEYSTALDSVKLAA